VGVARTAFSAAVPPKLQQVQKVVARELSLAEDRVQRSSRQVAVPVYGNDDEPRAAGAAHVVVAAADVDDVKAGPLERPCAVLPLRSGASSGYGDLELLELDDLRLDVCFR